MLYASIRPSEMARHDRSDVSAISFDLRPINVDFINICPCRATRWLDIWENGVCVCVCAQQITSSNIGDQHGPFQWAVTLVTIATSVSATRGHLTVHRVCSHVFFLGLVFSWATSLPHFLVIPQFAVSSNPLQPPSSMETNSFALPGRARTHTPTLLLYFVVVVVSPFTPATPLPFLRHDTNHPKQIMDTPSSSLHTNQVAAALFFVVCCLFPFWG